MHGFSEQLIFHYLWKLFLCTSFLQWYQSSQSSPVVRRLIYKLLRLVDSHLRLSLLLCHEWRHVRHRRRR